MAFFIGMLAYRTLDHFAWRWDKPLPPTAEARLHAVLGAPNGAIIGLPSRVPPIPPIWKASGWTLGHVRIWAFYGAKKPEDAGLVELAIWLDPDPEELLLTPVDEHGKKMFAWPPARR